MTAPFSVDIHELLTPDGMVRACERARRWLAHRGLSHPGPSFYLSAEGGCCAVGHLVLAAAQGSAETAHRILAWDTALEGTAGQMASWVSVEFWSVDVDGDGPRMAFQQGFDRGIACQDPCPHLSSGQPIEWYTAGYELGLRWAQRLADAQVVADRAER